VAYFDLPGLAVEFSRHVEQTAGISGVFVKAPEITAARKARRDQEQAIDILQFWV
jgi:hypothetical protein